MASPIPAALAHGDDRATAREDPQTDHNFVPDFAWAAGGGVVLVICTLLLMLTVLSGGWSLASVYGRELAAAFLAGFLVVLVARSLTARSR